MNSKTAAGVILYHPDADVYDNILSYLHQVERVYVVDNSSHPDPVLTEKLVNTDNVCYMGDGVNKGIAAALNTAANKALADGFRFLLTMDQDTRVEEGYVSALFEAFTYMPEDRIGIIAPDYAPHPRASREKFQPVLVTMTSGNLLNLDVFRVLGPFLEELFIDHVDHEYCLRINKNGYSVIQANTTTLAHRPGNPHPINLYFKTFRFSSHSPLRFYYYCRNGFYVSRLYRASFPEFKKLYRHLLIKEVVKVLLLKNRAAYLREMIRGIKDYRSGKLGKYPYDKAETT